MRGSHILLVLFLVVTYDRTTIRAQDQSSLERQELRDLLPGLGHSAQARASAASGASGSPFDRLSNEDHSNIELDKIGNAHRYELTPEAAGSSDLGKLPRLVEMMEMSGANARPYILDMLRGDQTLRNPPRDDKDYRFVSMSLPVYSLRPAVGYQPSGSQADKLRDLVVSNTRRYR